MLRILTSLLFAACALLIGTRVPAQTTGGGEAKPAAAIATFAAGCFWCVEADFDKVKGVLSTTSGYMGGQTKNPTYKEVASGRTGHAEVVQVEYDPKVVTYEQLLDSYWRNVDPLDKDGQFCDRGSPYRPVIFYHTEEQRVAAEKSKAAIEASRRFKQPIVVPIEKATEFTRAEHYHQNYYKVEALRYAIYRHGCGRDARLEALWGKKPD